MPDNEHDNIDDTDATQDGGDGTGVDPHDDDAAQDANTSGDDNGTQDDAGDDKPDPKVAAELRKLKRENQRLRRERNEARKATEAGNGTDDNADAQALRAELEQARNDAAELRLQTAVERIANGMKFHDPEDALALLNRNDIDVDPATGVVDAESVKDALTELAERKPHLVNKGGAGAGSGMGGGKQTGTPQAESIADRRARLGLGRRTEPIRFDRGGVIMPGSSDNRGLVQRAAAKSRKSE